MLLIQKLSNYFDYPCLQGPVTLLFYSGSYNSLVWWWDLLIDATVYLCWIYYGNVNESYHLNLTVSSRGRIVASFWPGSYFAIWPSVMSVCFCICIFCWCCWIFPYYEKRNSSVNLNFALYHYNSSMKLFNGEHQKHCENTIGKSDSSCQ